MDHDSTKQVRKQQIASKLSSVIKDLKRLRAQVVFVDMEKQLRRLDTSVSELSKVKKEILRSE